MKAARAARRDALLALLDEILRQEARADPPGEAERGDWILGNVGLSRPDQHGWVASVGPRMWMPKALCFWRAIIRVGGQGGLDEISDPRHSLARWPELQQAVLDYMSRRPWSRFRF